MISKPMFFAAIVCTGVLATGVVMYQRSRAEVAALRAQVGAPAAPTPRAPSLGAVQAQPAAAQGAEAPPAGEAQPAADNPLTRVLSAPTLADALKVSLPEMEDVANKQSDGSVLLAFWGAARMKWADVAVAKNETSVAKILKDSDAERGKRLCLGGDIIQIAKQRGVERIYAGLLGAYYGQGIISFFAVGDTGDLVEQSAAKFCGVVTGRFTYSNSGGGTTHAVSMVGMFDLPGNNPNKRRKVAANDDE